MRVLMIGGGSQQVRAVELAQSWGYHVTVTDRRRDAPCRDVADDFWIVDGYNYIRIANIEEDGGAYFGKDRPHVDGVFTMTEMVETVGYVANRLGLPGSGQGSAMFCQSKMFSKREWIKAGVPTPPLLTQEEANTIPAFSRPIVGSGSVGARLGWRGDGYVSDQYMPGTHHDVTGIFDDEGELHCAGISERFFATDVGDDLIETGAHCPGSLDDGQRAELLDLVKRGANALGITSLAVKADVVLSDGEFYLLEMAPRLHGPKSTLWLYPEAMGFHPLKAYLQVVTGQKLDPELLKPRYTRPTRYDLVDGRYMMGDVEIGRRR